MAYKEKTAASARYAEKLRNPHWRARREEILQRDNYTCRGCGAHDAEPAEEEESYDLDPPEKVRLEVHHKYYEWGKDPWDYPNAALITLCEMCHDTETAYAKEALQKFTQAARTRFLSRDLFKLAHAIQFLQMPFRENKRAARLITWALTSPEALGVLQDLYEHRNKDLRPIGDFLPGLEYAHKEMAQG